MQEANTDNETIKLSEVIDRVNELIKAVKGQLTTFERNSALNAAVKEYVVGIGLLGHRHGLEVAEAHPLHSAPLCNKPILKYIITYNTFFGKGKEAFANKLLSSFTVETVKVRIDFPEDTDKDITLQEYIKAFARPLISDAIGNNDGEIVGLEDELRRKRAENEQLQKDFEKVKH